MKLLYNSFIFAALVYAGGYTQAQSIKGDSSVPPPTQPTIISREANSRVWERTEYEQGPNGQIIPKKHHYTELATGLCYEQNGRWMDSQEQISILPDGSAAATKGQHQAYFPSDIYNGVMTLITPDGLQLKSQPVGLSYDDGSNTVLIAILTNSIGQLISPNQVIYTNAFTGIDADLLYTYRMGGFEQDVIFRQQPPVPEQFGLDSADTRLQMLTEFVNAPTPVKTIGAINRKDRLQDTTLQFGKMKMRPGRAFLTGKFGQKNDLQHVPVYKSWVDVNGRALLVEELPYQRINSQLSSLPMPSAVTMVSAKSPLHKLSSKRLLPPVRLANTQTHTGQLAKANPIEKPGFVLDYAIILSNETNFTFQGDTTYYVTNEFALFGTTTIEGSSIIKFSSSGQLDLDSVVCDTAPYRPAIITSQNDDSIGEPIWGISTGSPNYSDVPNLFYIGPTSLTFHDIRFSYAEVGFSASDEPNLVTARDCQFLNVETPFWINNVALYDVLIGYSTNDSVKGGTAEIIVDGGLVAENVTSDSGSCFLLTQYPGGAICLTNCLITGEVITNVGQQVYGPILTNAVVYLPTATANIYHVVGGGNYYLTNGSPYRACGTANIDPLLYAELAIKTTYPPIVYKGTNLSLLGTLGPAVLRDTNTFPDIGYHYDPIDYAFGGCVLTNSLTFASGTAVVWFEANGSVNISGQPYGISLNNGANLSFNGIVTEPCVFARSTQVQEGGNGSWGNTGWNLGMVFMGSSQEATVSANFTDWTSTYFVNILQDRGSKGQGFFKNCEFYNNAITTWNVQYLYYTNCLLFRPTLSLWNSPNLNLENCTVFNGAMVMDRSSAVNWLIENCSFDGTGFNGSDIYSGTSHTTIDHNAYNTNNLSWQTYPLSGPYNGKLEVSGSSDVMVTNYNWESSWFGSFYLPTNSPVLQMGSTNANLLGLYHFTTQTNQIPNGTNIVDIGYHYVATDQYGNPLDSNGDGIPDYLEDANGNGLVDNGESPWYYTLASGLTAANGLLLYTPLK
jgi:hypothetical protein